MSNTLFMFVFFCFSSRRRHTRCALVTGVQTCALPISSNFGVRHDPFNGGAAMHAGIDMAGRTGEPIYATADGIVEKAGWGGGYGNMVDLAHGRGIETRYGHLSKVLVREGQRSEEHTSELQSLMRISYAVFGLKKKKRLQTRNK